MNIGYFFTPFWSCPNIRFNKLTNIWIMWGIYYMYSSHARLKEKKLHTKQHSQSSTSSQTTHGKPRQCWPWRLSPSNSATSGSWRSSSRRTSSPRRSLSSRECQSSWNPPSFRSAARRSWSSMALWRPPCKSLQSLTSSRNSRFMIPRKSPDCQSLSITSRSMRTGPS